MICPGCDPDDCACENQWYNDGSLARPKGKRSSMSLVDELLPLQRAYNEWFKNATPEERAKAARQQLRYIGTVEPEMAWVLDALSEDRNAR